MVGFQSTRPHGARRMIASLSARASGFNPRAREGRDRGLEKKFSSSHSFNPRARVGRDRRSVSFHYIAIYTQGVANLSPLFPQHTDLLHLAFSHVSKHQHVMQLR